MRKIHFVNHQYYHIYNRGVEKRKIFGDDKDRFRFIHDLYELNDQGLVNNINFRFNQNYGSSAPIVKSRKLLVKILCFCLMPNHFHFILEQLVDNGISRFMHKLGTGYTNGFNLRYKRVGPLFQGRYKAILINNENYFLHLSRYIHLNPVELIEPEWKEEGIKNWRKVNEFLENYRWSSYLDYIGKKNFPSVINKDLLGGYFSLEEYKEFVNGWLTESFEKIGDLILEE